jgi:mannose/cellobiose epimerase-like protein (N-acyl-D-glucosamine 2-epimerase family)
MTPSVSREARDWLRHAIAFWAAHGLDQARGGYHEYLSPGALDCAAGFRRLRVMTRQIYVFSSPLGHDVPGAAEALQVGLAQLRKARHPEGGYASRLTLDGAILDDTRDLYDLAFVLFALCHAFARLGDPALRDEARALMGFIEAEMAHPAGGYAEAIPPRQPRRQNPHMHLLEAVVHWAVLDPQGPFSAVRDRLLDLFVTRFFDPSAGILREYLADDLTSLPAPEGVLWEPGHHFEWVWLLDMAARGGANVPVAAASGLMARARAEGLHSGAGAVWGELTAAGEIMQATTRIWTLTEWIKAECVTPGPDRIARVAAAWSALRGFLDVPVPGLWSERWDAATGRFPSENVPATSLYHIAMAVHVMQDLQP